MERQRQKRYFDIEVDTDRLFGPIEDSIKYLQEIKTKYPNVKLTSYGYIGDVQLEYSREETDEEYSQRIEGEQKIENKKR